MRALNSAMKSRVAVVAALDQAVVGEQQHRVAAGLDAGRGGEADDRVAAEALATLHGFEQVAVGRVGELQVNRKGVSRSEKVSRVTGMRL
jgi:hypothetical protein